MVSDAASKPDNALVEPVFERVWSGCIKREVDVFDLVAHDLGQLADLYVTAREEMRMLAEHTLQNTSLGDIASTGSQPGIHAAIVHGQAVFKCLEVFDNCLGIGDFTTQRAYIYTFSDEGTHEVVDVLVGIRVGIHQQTWRIFADAEAVEAVKRALIYSVGIFNWFAICKRQLSTDVPEAVLSADLAKASVEFLGFVL